MNALTYIDGQMLFGNMYALAAHKSLVSNTDAVEYSTIDGAVITHHDCVDAVSNGSGIFIGDYFVGPTESNNILSGHSFIRY